MSVNKEEDEGDEGHPNTLAIPTKIQDELIHVIQISLITIATQVNNLNKCAEDIIDEIRKEVDRLSFRVVILEEHVIQLMNDIIYKDQKGGLSSRIMESQTSQSTTIQTQQVYSSKQAPVQMCEMHDTHELTLPMYRSPFCPDDTGGLEVSPDASHRFQVYKEKTVPGSEEEKGAKRKQKQHKDHPSKPASVPQTQLMEDHVSVYHVPAACREASPSYVDQPDESSSFSSLPLCEINKLVTRAVGEVISSSPYLPTHGAGEVKNSLTYVRYGTGRGEELKPQPRNHLQTKVFVSPTAPASAPSLPTDWLAASKASKMETPSSSIHLPAQLPSPVLRTPAATSAAACLPGVPDRAVPITAPKRGFSTPAVDPLPYYVLTIDSLLAQAEGQGMPPLLSSSAVTSPSVQTRATVTHLIGPTSAVRSPTPSVTKLSISSISSSPRSSLSPSPSYCIPPPRYPVTVLPRSSTPRNSSPLSSICSCPQSSRSWIPSLRDSLSLSTRSSDSMWSRCSEAQSLRPSAAQSQRSSMAQSTRHLIPPQQNSSSLKSAKSSTLQSLFSFEQSPSCLLSSSGPSVTPAAPAPVNATFKQSPPPLPVIAKVRTALMAAIRKGILLYKTEDQ